MSTTSYRATDTHSKPSGRNLKRKISKVGPKAASILVSESPSRSRASDRNCALGLTKATDDDLIIAAQHGDEQAFVELFRRHSPVAKMKIRRIVQNHED